MALPKIIHVRYEPNPPVLCDECNFYIILRIPSKSQVMTLASKYCPAEEIL